MMRHLVTVATVFLVIFSVVTSSAQERFELGFAAGTTYPMGGDSFKSSSTHGDGQNYWLAYSLNENWAAELALDNLDFDKSNTKSRAVSLNAVYRFIPTSMIHPIAKLGAASYESISSSDAKTNSIGAKLSAGLEADFAYISIGTLINFHHIQKINDAADLKNTQAVVTTLFFTLHNLNLDKKK